MKKLVVIAVALAFLVSVPAFACGAKNAAMKDGAACPMMMKGVERSAANLDNGVKITLTAKDAESAKTLQTALAAEMKDDTGCQCPMHEKGVSKSVENTEKGVILTLTSADKEQVKSLQAYATKMCAGGKGECPMHKNAKKAA